MTKKNSISVGTLTYFRGSNVWIKPVAMAALLTKYSVDQTIPELEKLGVGRATSAARNFRAEDIRVDVISRTRTEVEFGILRRSKVADHEVRWDQFEHVVWSEASGWSTPTTETGREFIEYAVKWQTHLDYYWLRGVLMDQLSRLGAFSLGGGGVQYVHSDLLPRFEELRSLVFEVSGARLYSIRIDPSDADSVSAVGDAARDHALGQVDEVVTRLNEWREKAKGRTSTLEGLLTELSDVRGRAIALSTALRFSTEEVDAAIASAEADLRKTLDVATAAKAAPAVEEKASPAPATTPETVVEPVEQEPAEEDGILAYSVEELEGLGSKDLRKLCHKIGIKGYAKMSDAGRVVALLQAREQASAS